MPNARRAVAGPSGNRSSPTWKAPGFSGLTTATERAGHLTPVQVPLTPVGKFVLPQN